MKKHLLSELSEYQLKLCWLFSEYSIDSSQEHYANRGQSDIDKVKSDIYHGKMAEFMVYNYFTSLEKDVSFPDIAIYKAGDKNFDADLVAGNTKLHVKCHVENSNFPISWLFQKNDELVKSRPDGNFLCLVVFSASEYYMYVCDIKNAKFSEPIKEVLKGNKTCFYLSENMK